MRIFARCRIDNGTLDCKESLQRCGGGDGRVPTNEAFPMAAQLGTHPSADALRGFAAGKLDDGMAAEVMSHLDSCPDCCRAAAGLSSDDFLDRLRLARGKDEGGGMRDEERQERSEEHTSELQSRGHL